MRHYRSVLVMASDGAPAAPAESAPLAAPSLDEFMCTLRVKAADIRARSRILNLLANKEAVHLDLQSDDGTLILSGEAQVSMSEADTVDVVASVPRTGRGCHQSNEDEDSAMEADLEGEEEEVTDDDFSRSVSPTNNVTWTGSEAESDDSALQKEFKVMDEQVELMDQLHLDVADANTRCFREVKQAILTQEAESIRRVRGERRRRKRNERSLCKMIDKLEKQIKELKEGEWAL